MLTGSDVVAMARTAADMGALATAPRWTPLQPDRSFREWTDDYSNILAAIARRIWPAQPATCDRNAANTSSR